MTSDPVVDDRRLCVTVRDDHMHHVGAAINNLANPSSTLPFAGGTIKFAWCVISIEYAAAGLLYKGPEDLAGLYT